MKTQKGYCKEVLQQISFHNYNQSHGRYNHTYIVEHSPLGLLMVYETQSIGITEQPEQLARRQSSPSAAEELNQGLPGSNIKEWSERASNPGCPDLKATTLTTGNHRAALPPEETQCLFGTKVPVFVPNWVMVLKFP